MSERSMPERVVTYILLPKKDEGVVLTREILQHGMHLMNGKRDGKCLRCYSTIVLN